MLPNLYVGFDIRMPDAYMVAVRSALDQSKGLMQIKALMLPHLRATRAYTRRTLINDGMMWDEISDAPMSTQFAISRFLIPYLQMHEGFSIFCDSDFLFRTNPIALLKDVDPRKAVSVVKHEYQPDNAIKMDGQLQTVYARKNWSSLMVINNAHPSNTWLTPANVNATPGRDLHRFCWLQDDEIGELDPAWNWLEGHSPVDIEPKAVHYTRGTPDMPGYENAPYADEWRAILGAI